MRIQNLRNATAVLTLGPHRLLLDPMLGAPGSQPGFRMPRTSGRSCRVSPSRNSATDPLGWPSRSSRADTARGCSAFSPEELVELVRLSPGVVVLNHLEAVDHCPTPRAGLRARMAAEGLSDRALVPEDGETLEFIAPGLGPSPGPIREDSRSPGFQKRLTSLFTAT